MAMQSRKVEATMVIHSGELGQLNHSLNDMYNALLSNIYQLESELNKERNAELLKKRFLAQATHELKTPIAVIRGYAEILYDGMYKDADEQERYLKNIYDETEAISHLIGDVLDYTKMETGNDTLVMREVEAADFFGTLIDRYQPLVKNQKITLVYSTNIGKGTMFNIDQRKIEQVFKNLISNAMEHAESTIKINVEATNKNFKLTIYNDGPSISEDDLPNVFDSFYKRSGKKSGTGLGLAIVKEIVLQHGGDYRVANIEKGVMFVISI
jgi:signal transduction histidine kinase